MLAYKAEQRLGHGGNDEAKASQFVKQSYVSGRIARTPQQAVGAHRFKPPENDNRVTVLLTACRAWLWLESLADLQGNT
jgi:hypothetical protein